MRMRRAVICLLVMVSILALSGSALAETLTVKMSYNGPPDEVNNAVHYYAVNFKKLVEDKLEGKIKIELYPDSQLGTEEERMQLLTKSGLNQPIINVASYAGMAPLLPEAYAASIPFMFDSYKAAHQFFDSGRYWSKVKEEFKKRTGAVLLEAVEEGGFLAFTNSRREIKSPDDFKGLKFRAMDEGQVTLYKAFGASGIPIPWTELYMALKTGVVDGQMNPATYIIIGSLYEVQKYMTLANIQYSDQFLVVNGDLFDGLPEADQKAIAEAAHKANVMTRQMVESQDAEQIKFLEEKGMKVYAPNEKEMNAFRSKGQPAYIEWLKATVDEKWLNMALEDAKAANEAVK